MLLETCQLLYTCHWIIDGNVHNAPYKKGTTNRGYKKSHWNHPCSKWIRTSAFCYRWLSTLGIELLREYEYRYPGKIHACATHIFWLHQNCPKKLVDNGWIEPAMAMPDNFKNGDPVSSYRRYYIGAKKDILIYTKRHKPHWLEKNLTGQYQI
jgi:hypothetical protein